MSVHLLYGEDDFRIKEALAEARQQVGVPDLRDANTTNLPGLGLTPMKLVQACSMVPFLADKRMIIVEGLISLFEPMRRRGQHQTSIQQSQDIGPWKDLAPSLRMLPSTTALIFLDGKLSLNNPLLKIISNVAEIKKFPTLRGEELRSWVRRRLTASNGDIVPGALRLICELIGGNLWAMRGELDKLQLYTQGRSIEEQDVRLLVAYAREANVFSMVDAVLDGRNSVAIKEIHELTASGESTTYIIIMLARQLRLILLAKELSQKEVPDKQWSTRLGLASGFAINKIRDQAKRHDENHLLSLYRRLLRLDLEIKTGELDGTIGLELLVCQVSTTQV